MTVYTINFEELQFRFHEKKDAEKFLKNNYRDYMDSEITEVEIETDEDAEVFWDNGIHPYDKEVDRQNTLADGFIL